MWFVQSGSMKDYFLSLHASRTNMRSAIEPTLLVNMDGRISIPITS